MRRSGDRRVFKETMMNFAEGLPISLIANPLQNVTVYTNDELADILSNPTFREHNLLLVNNEDRVGFFDAKYIGYIEKETSTRTGKVIDCNILPLRDYHVTPDTPIMDFVEKNIPCAFIGDEDGISGFVAESDLQKPAVKVLAFTLVTQLEECFRRAIDARVTDASQLAALLSRLSLKDWKHIENNRRTDRRHGQERSLVEYTSLSQEIQVLKEIDFITDQDVEELRTIRDMRNALGHGHTHIQEFIPRLRKTIEWVTSILGCFTLLNEVIG